MLKQSLQHIIHLVNAGCRIRSEMEHLPLIDTQVQTFLKEHNFVYQETDFRIMRLSTDERLANIEEKSKQVKGNPMITLQEQSKKILSVMRTFLSRYHVGFLHDVHINKYGTIEIEIPCLITSSTSSKEYSPLATFNAQVEFLRQHGFILDKAKTRQVALINTPDNQKLLYELFASRGAKNIVMAVREDCIDRISFLVKLQDIENFRCEPILVHNEGGEYLNDEEAREVVKLCNDILHAMDFIAVAPEMTNTCCSLIESYFADICEIYRYEGASFKNVKSRYAAERAKNERIRAMEQAVNVVDYEEIRKLINTLTETLNEDAIRATGFSLDKFELNQYGGVSVSFRYSTSPALWCIEPEEVETTIRSTFTVTDGDLDNETLYICMTEENIEKLERALEQLIPTFRAMDVSATKHPEMTLTAISGVIDNIAPTVERILKK